MSQHNSLDNVPQAKWLETAPPDEVMIQRFTRIITIPGIAHYEYVYFDTGTDLIFTHDEQSGKWMVTDPNRKGIFA